MNTTQLSPFPSDDLFNIMRATSFGFDDIFDNSISRLQAKNGLSSFDYPPTDIIELDKNSWLIRIALSGRKKDDISVVKEKNILKVSASTDVDLNEKYKDARFQSRGISMKSFKREYVLGEYVEVDKITYENGLLEVHLQRDIPEEQKPKILSIE